MWSKIVLLLSIVCIGSCFAEQNKQFRERAEIYSRLTECDYFTTDEYNYTHFVDLSTIKDAQSSDYYARVPIYVIGPRYGNIILSSSNTPNREKDFVYEIGLGSHENTKTRIRKRIDNYQVELVDTPNILSELRPLKALIEISKHGHIRVYTDNKAKPIIDVFDPFTLQVKYISFASEQGASNEFLYNCVSDQTTLDQSEQAAEPVSADPNNLSLVPLDQLAKQCEMTESYELEYKSFHLIENLKYNHADGYLFKLNFFVFGRKESHLLLSETEESNVEAKPAYEIVIGGYGNTQIVIRKTAEDELFEKVQLKDLLSETHQTRVLVQMTKEGRLEVFVGETQYKPVIEAFDSNPIAVKYVSFASNDGARNLYFYNCEDKKASDLLAAASYSHPLLDQPIEHDESVLDAKCKHIHAWEDIYKTPIKFDAHKTEKLLFQFVFYVKGVRDAHILLTPTGLNPSDGYEIVIGGWGNTKNLIRKYGKTVAKTLEYNVLNEHKTIKVIVEATHDGIFRVYTEANKSQPLLEFKDKSPIENLNTASFTAYYRDLDFYYNCSA